MGLGLYLGTREMAMGLQAPGYCGGASQGASCYIFNLGTVIVGRGVWGGRGRAPALPLPPGWGGESKRKPLPQAHPHGLHMVTPPGHPSTILLITPRAPTLPFWILGP